MKREVIAYNIKNRIAVLKTTDENGIVYYEEKNYFDSMVSSDTKRKYVSYGYQFGNFVEFEIEISHA